jgi:hypothetical protein
MKKVTTLCAALALLALTAMAATSPTALNTLDAYKAGLTGNTRGAGSLDNVGDVLRVITTPIGAASGVAVSVAVDCRGLLYYTNFQSDTLYKCDAFGNFVGWVPMVDAAGTAILIDEISWDENRQVLWGAEDNTHAIYTVDPNTGLATYQFPGQNGYQITDGFAYDPSDGTLWHSTDVSADIAHFSVTGTYLGSLTPLDAGGNPQGTISGICVGSGNTMYVGHNGQGVVTRVDKTTGAFMSTFAVVGGRDEGMECDAINFAPNLVMWIKGAYDNSLTAVEVENGTCACAVLPDTCQFPYEVSDLGDLFRCNYPTLPNGPAHGLSGIAWLGANITAEANPHVFDLDAGDDGVVFLGLPWTPCSREQVQVTVTAGPNYDRYLHCGGHLYLNAWKDGNLNNDFCDELCNGQVSEWILQDVLVTPGTANYWVMDPGVTDMGVYAGVFRFRLTSQPVGRFGFGVNDGGVCPSCQCMGTFGQDFLGEVEDYYVPDGQLAAELADYSAVSQNGHVELAWSTASETDNDHFEVMRNDVQVASIHSQGNTASGHTYRYSDASVEVGSQYEYTLVSVDLTGTRKTLGSRTVTVNNGGSNAVVTEYALHQNFPNPFNPTTQIAFDLVESGHVTLTVFNPMGQEVTKLVNGNLGAGTHSVSFNAAGLPSGIYFYRLNVNGFSADMKMLLMK